MSFSEDPTQGTEQGAAAGEDPAGSGAADTTADPTGGVEVGDNVRGPDPRFRGGRGRVRRSDPGR